jgi:hypothetical protein
MRRIGPKTRTERKGNGLARLALTEDVGELAQRNEVAPVLAVCPLDFFPTFVA